MAYAPQGNFAPTAESDILHELAHAGRADRLSLIPPSAHFNFLSSSRGHSVLYSACRAPHPDSKVVALLIDKGCNVHQRNTPQSGGSFPQHGVVRSLRHSVESMKIAGCNQEHVFESVQSLLEIAHILVLNGADMDALNSRNRTAFDDFMDIQHEFTVQPLIQMTGSLHSLLKPGPTGQLPHPHHTQPVPPARDTPPPAPAAHCSWFAKVFGFEEKDGGHTGTFDFVRSQLSLAQNALGAFVFTTPHGKQLWAGRFTHESLSNLHGKLQGTSGVQYTYEELRGDVSLFIRNPSLGGALFQVASQFNLLEMISPDVGPEAGVTIYQHDRTQGPVCAMACPAGTVFRNYFVNGTGQDTPEHQIDGLKQAHSELLQMMVEVYGSSTPSPPAFWDMKNGYCMPPTLQHLQAVNQVLDPALPGGDDRRRRFMNSIAFGTQWDTQVGCIDAAAGSAPTPFEWCHKVAQIYCSALPVAYNRSFPSRDWTHFATAVLQAAYEATFAAAAVLSRERDNARVMVFLTRVGGGAFGNDASWIQEAIVSACNRYAGYPIDIKMVNYAPGVDYSGPAAAQTHQHCPAPPPPSHRRVSNDLSAAGSFAHVVQAPPAVGSAGAHPGTGTSGNAMLSFDPEVLWEAAYTTARLSGAIDQLIFDKILRLRDQGHMSHAEVAAWVNRSREPSGYTLLHQMAWHGKYAECKQVFERMGADKELRTNDGATARQIAQRAAQKSAME